MTTRIADRFKSAYWRERGLHLARIPDYAFNRTDVHDILAKANEEIIRRADIRIGRKYPLIEGRLGDPTQYPGLGASLQWDRFSNRVRKFYTRHELENYSLTGDDNLIKLLRMGWRGAPGYQRVPKEVVIYMTDGVAGALRLITDALVLPPPRKILSSSECAEYERIHATPHAALTEADIDKLKAWSGSLVPPPVNVVMPVWTYVSHLAETVRAHGNIKTCGITPAGQVDAASLEHAIDQNTRAVLFATVGNPLSVAMEPAVFDDILRVVRDKMKEYNHSIVVLADTIYEHFRRDPASRIDPIQRALHLDNGVPVVELSSFSKMMGIPGLRVGYPRIWWDPSSFADERHDFLLSLEWLYWPTLGQVSTDVQRTLAELYTAVRNDYPVEEKLAPIAAILCALKELNATKGRESGSSDTGYFSARAIADSARKLANNSLAKYDIDLSPDLVRDFLSLLSRPEIGLVDAKEGDPTRYKLKVEIPPVPRDGNGQLILCSLSEDPERRYSLSEDHHWKGTAKMIQEGCDSIVAGINKAGGTTSEDLKWKAILEECGIETEGDVYREDKRTKRDTALERVTYFATELDRLRSEGIYLHPAYYGPDGELDLNRLNAFYILWGFDRLNSPSLEASQAALFAQRCVDLGLPIVANTPAELFLPPEERGKDRTYMRTVALQGEIEMNRMLSIIYDVARDLRSSIRPSIAPPE